VIRSAASSLSSQASPAPEVCNSAAMRARHQQARRQPGRDLVRDGMRALRKAWVG